MADYGERYTEAEYRRVKQKIEAVYKEAYRDIVEKSEEWAEKHEKRARRYQQMVKDGKLSKADYDAWMRGQVFQGNQWKARKQQIADTLYHADRTALDIANKSRYKVFTENANTMGYGLEQHGRIDTGFTLYDSNSVARLVRDEPDLLPPKKRVGKDASYRWYNRQIGNVVTQGIIQGETVREIARRIAKKTGETNCSAMLRNARTMYTGVQNAGRLEGMRQAQRLGIRVQKRWIAILDHRTRDSHQALDGQVQEVEDPFVSPLGRIMYPGDEGADDPADVWNCRCSMIYEHPEYPSHMERRDAETGEIVGDMTYEEWAEMKAERGEEASASQPAAASNKDQPSGKTGLTGSGKDGTMKVSTGGRRNDTPLTEQQKNECLRIASQYGMPRERVVFSDDMYTGYFPLADKLYIGTDVYPAGNTSKANYMISHRGTLAHELIGHRDAALAGKTQGEEYLEEAQASVRASRAPGLSQRERDILFRDAQERLPDGMLLEEIMSQLYLEVK